MKKIKDTIIQTRLLIGLGLIVAILPLILFGFGFYYAQLFESDKLTSSNTEKNNLVSVLLENSKNMLSSDLEIIASIDTLKQQFKDRDREALFVNADTFFKQLNQQNNITHLYFIDTDGKVFLRVHDKNNYGDIVTRDTFKEVVRTGSKVSGMELGKTGFALRAVMPFKDGDKLLGYVEIGKEINDSLITLKDKTGSDFEALGDKQYLNETDWLNLASNLKLDDTWDSFDKYATVAETKHLNELDGCVSKSMDFGINAKFNYDRLDINNKTLVCNETPLTTLNNKVIGALVYSSDITDIVTSTRHTYQFMAVISIILGSILWSVTYFYIRRLLFRPLSILRSVVDEIIETGDLSRQVPEDSNNEFGSLGKSFNKLKNKLKKSQLEMEEKVQARTSDLQVLNSSMVGRELRMIELKKQVVALQDQAAKASDSKKVDIK